MKSMKTMLDRRVLKTRQVILDSFVHLMLAKDFSQISIKDIIDQANISRSTFYSHYQDKYDLMDKSIHEKLVELQREVLAETTSDSNNYLSNLDTPDPFFLTFFEHLSRNRKLYQLFFNKSDSSDLRGKLFDIIRGSFYTRISDMEKYQKLLVPLDILLDSSTSSLLGITNAWFRDDMAYSPHYMALQLTRLSKLGLYSSIGLDERASQ